jgi:hypothetical protein
MVDLTHILNHITLILFSHILTEHLDEMDQPTKSRAPRYSAAQWEAQKPNIERLYVTEDRSLKEVIQVLSTEYGFTAR